MEMFYFLRDFLWSWPICVIRRHGRLFSFHNVQKYTKVEGRTEKESKNNRKEKKKQTPTLSFESNIDW